ncbi:hypothetical protein [Mucilaginibacter sp. CSA2-8R]|uniref:HNH endonuclease n=1 Tax=Mucilaginibacter sp. CSA2-8R TaxID=3141542 RepID=UPI00315C75D3
MPLDQSVIDETYRIKMLDPRWKLKRESILKRDEYKCRNCSSTWHLQVHHRQYLYLKKIQVFKDPWDYSDNLLITICRHCHIKGHQLYKIPIKYI